MLNSCLVLAIELHVRLFVDKRALEKQFAKPPVCRMIPYLFYRHDNLYCVQAVESEVVWEVSVGLDLLCISGPD